MKKRKADDGQAMSDGAQDVNAGNNNGGGFISSWLGYFSRQRDGGASSGTPRDENISQLDRMEDIMMRVEEKLATVSSLESRCEELERKCSSLENKLERKCSSFENKLESMSQSTRELQEHIDKTLKYHEMMIRNQNWKYSAPVFTMDELLDDFYDDAAEYIHRTSQLLKMSTVAMRKGDFPCDSVEKGGKGISLDINEDYPFFGDDIKNEMSPHWREFAAALKQFKPAFDVLPDGFETSIVFGCVQLNQEMTQLIKEALTNAPFKSFYFKDSLCFRGGMSTIAEMMGNNKYLQKIDLNVIQGMDRNDVAKLCSAIHSHPSVVDVTLTDCFSNGLGDFMLHSLLSTDELKLERLSMPENNLLRFQTGFNVCTLLSDYLATNPRLRELDLNHNFLNDSHAALIANALSSNTSLRYLNICENSVGKVGAEALCRALSDEISLNSIADSNHSCFIEEFTEENESEVREINRARKIYGLLSSRNETMSNVQYFGDIDLKLLPNVLEAVQKYSLRLRDGDDDNVKASSIVYEVMRRWDKLSSLYKSLGKPER
jgi:hypothetical protein